MIGHLIVRHNRLAEALEFHVFAVIPADRNAGVDDVRDHHHALVDLLLKLRLTRRERSHFVCHRNNLLLRFLRLVAFATCHHATDLLADNVALVAQRITPSMRCAPLGIHLHNLIHQSELFILKFFADVFLHKLRVCAEQLNVDHIPS